MGIYLIQVGAGGSGCAGKTIRIGLPVGKRFIGLRVQASADGDASGKSAKLDMVF
jgi:hypothetical protein